MSSEAAFDLLPEYLGEAGDQDRIAERLLHGVDRDRLDLVDRQAPVVRAQVMRPLSSVFGRRPLQR